MMQKILINFLKVCFDLYNFFKSLIGIIYFNMLYIFHFSIKLARISF